MRRTSMLRQAAVWLTVATLAGCGGSGGGGASCPSGQYSCGGRCIDPASDPAYCGAASDCSGGQVCAAGSFCDAGSCWSPCRSGRVLCGGECIDPATDRGLCGASGLCEGATAGVSCAPDRICNAGTCSCPEGQTECDGSCRFGPCGTAQPDFEWKASVPLTLAPHFAEPGTVIAHVVFDGQDMVDLTGHTQWTKVGDPPSRRSGMWTPPQYASGPFTSSDYWVGTAATRDYLRTATGGLFTACVRFKPGQLPITGPSKVIVALGKAEAEYGSATPLGGWVLMQTHESAGMHYIDSQRGEWALPNGLPVDTSTVASMEWMWFCAGVSGDPADADLASQRESSASVGRYPVSGTAPLQVAPAVAGFPDDIALPAIGAYPDGTHPFFDGQFYELLVTSDPATPESMTRTISLAEGGMLRWIDSPVLLTGADGATHVAAPSTVRVEPDGSVLAAQSVLLEPQMPASFDPAGRGQCWGVEASVDDWSDLGIAGQLLRWNDGLLPSPGGHLVALEWGAGSMCMHVEAPVGPGGEIVNWECGPRGTLAPWSVHAIQGCIAPDLHMTVYLDGVPISPGTKSLPDSSWIPHLEDPTSALSIEPVSSRVKLWRVWACDGADPAACP